MNNIKTYKSSENLWNKGQFWGVLGPSSPNSCLTDSNPRSWGYRGQSWRSTSQQILVPGYRSASSLDWHDIVKFSGSVFMLRATKALPILVQVLSQKLHQRAWKKSNVRSLQKWSRLLSANYSLAPGKEDFQYFVTGFPPIKITCGQKVQTYTEKVNFQYLPVPTSKKLLYEIVCLPIWTVSPPEEVCTSVTYPYEEHHCRTGEELGFFLRFTENFCAYGNLKTAKSKNLIMRIWPTLIWQFWW